MGTPVAIFCVDGYHLQRRIIPRECLAADADHRGWQIDHADVAVEESTVTDARHVIADDQFLDVCTSLVGIFSGIGVDNQCPRLCIPYIARLRCRIVIVVIARCQYTCAAA